MLVSVIVPVYNSEKYLCACLDSILAQSYSDFEVLLIDDGSTDKSGALCDEFSRIDNRVRVYHKQNGGVSSARNLGLDNAKGEWICFVDSDDTIPIDAFMCYVESISENLDLIVAKYCVYDEKNTKKNEYQKYSDRYFSQLDFLKELYDLENYQGYICSKLFRRAVIEQHHLRFDERIFFNEDRLFITRFVCNSGKSVCYTNHLTYHYIERQTGVMASLSKSYNRRFVTDFDALVLMKKEIEKMYADAELRNLSIYGILNSYNWNRQLMKQFNDYSYRNHLHMLRGLILSGIFPLYLKIVLKPLLTKTNQ